jgi:hypothetical protein
MPSYSQQRGGSSRGSGSSGKPGGGNAIAYAAAAAVVGLVVVLFLALSGGKGKPAPTPEKPAPTPPTVAPAAPTKPAEKPYPPLPEAKKLEGSALVKTFDRDIVEAERLYKESLKAKEAGNDAEWQAKLAQVSDLATAINDKWNDFIATLPSSRDYDEEQVARHYFYKESGIVARAGKLLAAMKSDRR